MAEVVAVTLAVMLVIGMIGGFICGASYERQRITDLLIDLAAQHKKDMEDLPR